MTWTVLTALLSYWRANPVQCLALVAGLSLATALWSGVQAINAEARASYDAAAAILGEGQFDQLVPRMGDGLAQSTYIALRRAGALVSPVMEGRLPDAGAELRLIGLDPLTLPGTLSPVAAQDEGRFAQFLAGEIVFAAPDVAEATAAFLTQRVQVDTTLAPGTVLADIGLAQRLLDAPGEVSRLIVAPEQPFGMAELSGLAPDVILRSAQEAGTARLSDSFHLNLTAFGFLSFAVGLFIVHGTIALAFEQRRGMVRTLRALGVPLTRLIGVMMAELLVLALVAGGIGVALGYLMAAMLLPNVAATLQGLYGETVSGALQLRPVWWLSGLAISVLGTAVAASGALWSLARMPLLASARPRAWAMASGQTALRLGGLALVLFGAGIALAIWGQGLVLAFALLACLLIGAALSLPLALRGVVALADRWAGSAVWGWFWADTRQQIPGMSLALMALLLATAANVGVSTMVSSFRITFVEFLDQRLAPELFVQMADAAQSARSEPILLAEADEVLPLLSIEALVADVPSDLFGVRVGPTYRENWVFLAGRAQAWDQVEAGRAVIVSEQLARRAGLWVDDTVEIAPDVMLPIVGIVADYGNPRGQALIAEPLFTRLFPQVAPMAFGLRTQDPAALSEVLVNRHGLPASAITDQSQIKAFSLGVFERTFVVTGALNILTLGVAGFAILMSLLTLAAIRVPQLAPIWALGLTRRALARFELLRAVLLALITTVLAIPLGVLLAWVLLAYVNVEAFGWRLPLYLFADHYAKLSALALLAAALAALWPAYRLAKTPPSELLKVFANDR